MKVNVFLSVGVDPVSVGKFFESVLWGENLFCKKETRKKIALDVNGDAPMKIKRSD